MNTPSPRTPVETQTGQTLLIDPGASPIALIDAINAHLDGVNGIIRVVAINKSMP